MPGRLLMAAAMVSWLAAAPAGGEVIDRVLATVNGHLVTLTDLRASLRLGLIEPGDAANPEAAALERWIERILVLQEVERYAPPEPEAAEVAEGLARIEARLGGPEALDTTVAQLGVTEAWVEQWLRDDLRTRAYIDQRFAAATEPTDEEIENYYRQHPGEFRRDGHALPAPEAQRLARERVMAERREAVVAEWLDDLRRRATITRPAPR